METLKFKTNINCGGCVAGVTPALNAVAAIDHWDVDTTNKEKILTVFSDSIKEEEVIEAVQKAGYRIEIIK